jgi:hypothetical protein
LQERCLQDHGFRPSIFVSYRFRRCKNDREVLKEEWTLLTYLVEKGKVIDDFKRLFQDWVDTQLAAGRTSLLTEYLPSPTTAKRPLIKSTG